jgi:hypothetical protein
MYVIQHCFIYISSDFTKSEDAGIEPRTVATLALTARLFNHLARSHLTPPSPSDPCSHCNVDETVYSPFSPPRLFLSLVCICGVVFHCGGGGVGGQEMESKELMYFDYCRL